MNENRIFILTFVLVTASLLSFAQTRISGIVVDSLTMDNIPGVNVKVKNSQRGAVTDAKGIFVILVNPQDSLTFSSIGYATITLPVADVADEIMFVRMCETSILLKEFILRDTKVDPHKYIYSPTLRETKPLPAAGINFGYFSKSEKEKRKLVAVIREAEQARIYIEIVTDPELKYDIMVKYSIDEKKFYELLAVFNENNRDVMYSANASTILYSLYWYFDTSLNKK